jgi:hypothetical protein
MMVITGYNKTATHAFIIVRDVLTNSSNFKDLRQLTGIFLLVHGPWSMDYGLLSIVCVYAPTPQISPWSGSSLHYRAENICRSLPHKHLPVKIAQKPMHCQD